MTAMPEQFYEIARRVNNWGRWGDTDERGTVNLITPDAVRRATGSVRTGRRISLAVPLSADGPQTGIIPGRWNPLRTMTMVNHPFTGDPDRFCTSDDVVTMGLQSGTHWDALAHASYGGKLYNGHPAESVTAFGAARCGIDKIGPLISRGILLDLPRALDVEQLAAGYAVTVDDLDAAAEHARVTPRSGDVVLIRTGAMRHLHAGDKHSYQAPSPGPSLETAEWFHRHDIAAVATDNITFEVYPPQHENAPMAVHLLHLVDMGLTQGQNFDLESLAADCAADGVHDFLLDASPEPFASAVGAPAHPVAVK